ncbi:hypothetical protein Y940_005243 [Salmonella enterica subsp. enterica]|nr:hypothetical protein [Salmonella enterica]ECF6721428.1 hypothetical protein [Salmonella enterica subsp. enterica]EDS4159365.1 hypothetical protein [Salmonella enterica subsp. enterica serovar Gaminara]EAP0965385.1 hypothetical protein [Salmonella enterica]EAU3240569.1 hypothetical protein [Salmonella enterica]
MKEFNLPKLPDNYRWGAETYFEFDESGGFQAPDGFAIKTVDMEKKVAICVPFQTCINGIWVTFSTK